MPSALANLNELTVVAVNDYLHVLDVSDPADPDKRISQTNLFSSYSVRSGVPTAGRLASWITPTTIGDSGVAVSQLAQKTGTPVANNIATWNDQNTVKDSLVPIANIPVKSGTLVAGNNAHWSNTTGTLVDSGFAATDIIRKSGTQTLTLLPSAILQVGDAAAAETINASSATGSISLNRYSANTTGPQLIFRKSKSATIGAGSAIANGDELGRIQFHAFTSSIFEYGAAIIAKVDGAPGAGDLPTRLEFQTSADGAASPTTVLTLGANNLATFAGGINLGQQTLSYFDSGAWPLAPIITGSSGAPVVNYSVADGYFMRLGNVCFFSFAIAITTISGGTGNMRIGNLPFVVGNQAQQPRFNMFVDGVVVPGTAPFAVAGFGLAGTNLIAPIIYQNNAAIPSLTLAAFGAGDGVYGSGFYLL